MSVRALTDLLIGTGNPGKRAEYVEILADLPLRLLTPADVGLADFAPDEPFETFIENARVKALAFAGAAGMPALADDSGLEVAALGGRPGVYSARYAGPNASDSDRTGKLLGELAAVPEGQRGARFVCVTALARPNGVIETAEGSVEGRIAFEAGERISGFGYDPVFIPDGYDRVFSALPAGEKHRISHRGRAAVAIRPALIRLIESG